MKKYYKGKREDGEWEKFISDNPEDATPEASGYLEVKEISEEEFLEFESN